MSEVGPLRRKLELISERDGVSLKDLTVLAVQNDPFRFDTPAGHRDGAWLAEQVQRFVPTSQCVHCRGLHYILATAEVVKPNGDVYRNVGEDWNWLQEKAVDAARWLRYLPFDRIVDQRNAAPVIREFTEPNPRPYISATVRFDIPSDVDIRPYVGAFDVEGVQPFKLVLIGEKSSLEPVLGPVAAAHAADLYLPTGEMSDTLIHRIATVGRADGRPMAVLYFSDCDPAGWQMGISVCRKLQALQALDVGPDEWELHRVALTPDQVREFALPSTPLKETEKRADRWREAMDVEQTEIDALAALQPDLLKRLATDAVRNFYDATLAPRAWSAYRRWQSEAQAELDSNLDPDSLREIQAQLTQRLGELRQEVEAINDALRIDPRGIELPPLAVPSADLTGRVHPSPLLDSRADFAAQTRRLIESKAYREVSA